MRTIRVYGRIAKFLKRRVFRAEIGSVAEAVKFLLANFPHLEPELAKGHYRVTVGTYDLSEEEIGFPIGQEEIKIVPLVSGAGAVGRAVAGVALIAFAILVPGLGTAAAVLFGKTIGGISLAIGLTGASLAFGGLSQLLTPVPKVKSAEISDSDKDPRKSFSFSGIQQTSRQGVPVPIIYGEILVGSVTVSAGVDTTRVS